MDLRLIKGKSVWIWGIIAAVIAVSVLFSTQAFSSSLTFTAEPLQNPGGDLTYTTDYSAASAIVTRHESSDLTLNGSDQITSVTVQGTKASGDANVTVELLDSGAVIVDTATTALPTASGSYSQLVTLTAGTVAYNTFVKVSAAYTASAPPAGVVFDGVGSGSGKDANSINWLHTVGAGGANRVLIVGISMRRDPTIATVTYGAASLTQLRRDLDTNSDQTTELWYLVAPVIGTDTITVTQGTGFAESMVGGSVSFTGVDQTTPISNSIGATASSTTASVTVTSATNEIAVGIVSTRKGKTLTTDAAQTERWNLAPDHDGAGSTKAGTASVAMSWGLTALAEWVASAASVKAAP